MEIDTAVGGFGDDGRRHRLRIITRETSRDDRRRGKIGKSTDISAICGFRKFPLVSERKSNLVLFAKPKNISKADFLPFIFRGIVAPPLPPSSFGKNLHITRTLSFTVRGLSDLSIYLIRLRERRAAHITLSFSLLLSPSHDSPSLSLPRTYSRTIRARARRNTREFFVYIYSCSDVPEYVALFSPCIFRDSSQSA